LARGAHFTFIINDQTVDALDDAHLKNGEVRVAVSVDKGQAGAISFDNFALQPR